MVYNCNCNREYCVRFVSALCTRTGLTGTWWIYFASLRAIEADLVAEKLLAEEKRFC